MVQAIRRAALSHMRDQLCPCVIKVNVSLINVPEK